MLFHRKIILCFSILLIVIFFSSCSVNNKNTNKKIIRWQAYANATYDAFRKKQGKNFQKIHPEIIVKYEPVQSGGYLQKLFTKMTTGASPDMFFMPDLPQFVYKNTIMDLTDYKNKDKKYFRYIYPALIQGCSLNGHLYGIPNNVSVDVLWINKDIFEKSGIPIPYKDLTWEKIYKLAKKLTVRQKHVVKQYGLVIPSYIYRQMFIGLNKTFFSKDYKKAYFDSPEMKRALKTTLKFIYSGYCATPQEQKNEAIRSAFIMGRAAMYYGSSWEVAIWNTKKAVLNWTAVEVPHFRGYPKKVFSGLNIMAIYKKTKYPKLVYEFTKFMANEQSIRFLINMGDSLPIRYKGKNKTYLMKSTDIDETAKKAFFNSLKNSISIYTALRNNPYITISKINLILSEELDDIIINNKKQMINSALKKVQKRIQSEINENIDN